MNAKGRRRQRREAQRAAEQAEQAAENAAQNARYAPAPEGRASAIETQNLQAQAIRERWPIRPAARPAIMDRLTKVALDPGTLPQFVVQASRAVFAADAINFEQEKRDAGIGQGQIPQTQIVNIIIARPEPQQLESGPKQIVISQPSSETNGKHDRNGHAETNGEAAL